jgi:uncharacterized membrane protein YgdD (TMEM256/DUF423 family)
MRQAVATAQIWWKRAIWMRIAALTGLTSVLILTGANWSSLDPAMAAKLRLGAQVQFMHGMVVFSCATFMNIGARDARHAPAFLFIGMLLYCMPAYVAAVLGGEPSRLVQGLGVFALGIGWTVLAWASREIDFSREETHAQFNSEQLTPVE